MSAPQAFDPFGNGLGDGSRGPGKVCRIRLDDFADQFAANPFEIFVLVVVNDETLPIREGRSPAEKSFEKLDEFRSHCLSMTADLIMMTRPCGPAPAKLVVYPP